MTTYLPKSSNHYAVYRFLLSTKSKAPIRLKTT